MDFEAFFTDIATLENITRLVCSDPRPGSEGAPEKLSLRPIQLRGEAMWQWEKQVGAQVFHENAPVSAALSTLRALAPKYRQLCVIRPGETVTYTAYGKRMKKTAVSNAIRTPAAPQEHDNRKQYLLPEGEPVPALVDLGIFTPQYRIVRSHYDKYRQINRFLELIDDGLREYPGREIRIMDFGCGKSYLTFILYYYLTEKRGLDAQITGYDLKADVVKKCNRIAEKYGYDRLHFVMGDVSRDTEDCRDIDMLVTLHACDTATDYALDYAIRNGIPAIFSVPCCQHEVNLSIHRGGEMDLFLQHGLLQERLSALLTDAIRAEILRGCGYEVDVIEFVDLSHTPKNLMLRASLRRGGAMPELSGLRALQEKYGFRQRLLELTAERCGALPRLSGPGKD